MTPSFIPHDRIPLNRIHLPETVWWDDVLGLYFLDQTLLPGEVLGKHQATIEQVFDSIKTLTVRGAPAIGVAGAYGLVVGMQGETNKSVTEFIASAESKARWLGTSRPTAVNLNWALDRMIAFCKSADAIDSADLVAQMLDEAKRIHDEDRELCRTIGDHGRELIRPDCGVLTHCNAGSLATSEFGTATSPMYAAHRDGVSFRVYADETRPLLQGARLTAWELQQSGIDVTLITDNMAAQLMSQGLIDLVIVGTDRVAANGDVANKIGTLGVAVLARHFKIPFYVACPYSTIDFDTPSGAGIPIEERDGDEVTSFGQRRTGPIDIQTRNPAFDVTPAELVTGVITERGLLSAPLAESMAAMYER